MSYIVKIMKCTIIQLKIVKSIIIIQTDIWNVITTNIDVNISLTKFNSVLKYDLHTNEVILKYTK